MAPSWTAAARRTLRRWRAVLEAQLGLAPPGGAADDGSEAAGPPVLRRVVVDDPAANARARPRFCHNGLTTSKYNVVTFLPKFLYEQFSRAANAFFLLVVLLQQVPGVSPLDPFTTMTPLLVVLAFTAVKEVFEDVKRHRQDYAVNHRIVQRLEGDRGFEEVEWYRLRVGDIVRVETDGFFPADLVLLASSEPDGIAYVETANLDGETNLKVKQSLPDTAHLVTHEQVASLRGATIHCEQPNNSLYTFEGTLERAGQAVLPLGPTQLLLRGAQLRNCRWIFGVVVFTGRDSKLARNSQKAPTKRSNVERVTNRQIVFMFLLLVVLALVSAVGSLIWNAVYIGHTTNDAVWYLDWTAAEVKSDYVSQFFYSFMTFIILYQNLIPISLIVTMEMVKFVLALLINSDLELYHAPNDTPARVRTSNLIEELGQVEYVFSDKTGTLTENKMELLKATIAGQRFAMQAGGSNHNSSASLAAANGHGGAATPASAASTAALMPKASRRGPGGRRGLFGGGGGRSEAAPLYGRQEDEDEDEADGGGGGDAGSSSMIELQELASAAAGDAASGSSPAVPTFVEQRHRSNRMIKLTEQPPDLAQDTGPPVDQSEAPVDWVRQLCEHGALANVDADAAADAGARAPPAVDAATVREFCEMMAVCHTVVPELDPRAPSGVRYQASSPDEAALVKGAAALGYTFLVRRPRSITVRMLGEEREYEILAVLEFNSTRKRMSVIVRTPEGKVVLYTKGADTVIMERLGPNQRYARETVAHLEAFAVMGLRTLCFAKRELSEDEFARWKVEYDAAAAALTDRDDQLMSVAELIEINLELLGASAVEDKLQAGVPETIQLLAEANIKLWVLTGDRQETAINIGHSCRLLNDSMSLIVCNEASLLDTKKFLENRLAAVEEMITNHGQTPDAFALIIDGQSLTYALRPEVSRLFVELGRRCRAVICCRVSPLQKALVVRLIKKRLNKITLAIGDGANDVGMIQAAHIGVGISGEEGLQAARSADFAIAQFRFLQRLLLVHGAWSLRRLAKLILYCFYKNIALYMVQFWFAWANGFSGQIAYEEWTISLYNVLFTALAPLTIGIFDRFLAPESLLLYPELYSDGQQGCVFNARLFWVWTLEAIGHSLIIFLAGVILCSGDIILASGLNGGMWCVARAAAAGGGRDGWAAYRGRALVFHCARRARRSAGGSARSCTRWWS